MAEGTAKLQPKVAAVATSSGNDVIPAHTAKESPVKIEHTNDILPNTITEYGYGFWFRFLTHYPARLWSGKNAAWYFLARLTFNVPVTDAAFGDRVLAVW